MATTNRLRRVRRGAYLLPSLFTVANLFCGYFALTQILEAVLAPEVAAQHLDAAAKAIGVAVLFDLLDGRLARLTNTASAFGREFDSLADVISFGVAPALLAFTWGIRWIDPSSAALMEHVHRAGWFLSFCSCSVERRGWRDSTSSPIRCWPIRGVQAANIFRAYLFRRRPDCWPRSCTSETADRWPGGAGRWRGWRFC